MPRPLAVTTEFASSPARPVPSAASVVSFGEERVDWAESPARLLHERLIATFSPPASPIVDDALPLRTKLAIIVGTSAALWAVIVLAVVAII